ncbi:hypothetical protein [Roseomonas haemaphysalidis]|uniref:PRC-barrel domain containing protein n=1 Tax=Roseomonas haemaphysalidis TaxID=2768162 RepID=A0ABS3KM39_9PROT|nr:hypothetical protein [Roseomonas haemaphysalidis]MBO1078521.1 hypothetical protein [Roseomonas haemaphysalidis]
MPRPIPTPTLSHIAMALLLLPSLAWAQAPPPAAAPANAPAEAKPTLPLAGREPLAADAAFAVLGRDIKEPSGTVVGQLVNILMDAHGTPRAGVVDYGGFLGVGKQRIAVAWRTLSFNADGIRLSLSHEQLRDLPDFKDGEAATLAVPPALDAAAAEGQKPVQ